ncbi:MAG TPA: S26 family signal peptidase, partial [Microbacterium sp.]|nr:S26 family signal peptidase [Microbacterium sp.]
LVLGGITGLAALGVLWAFWPKDEEEAEAVSEDA